MHLPFAVRLFYTVMTDDEFERIKAAERERLRAQARRLSRQGRAEDIVARMARGVERLLAETDVLIERLRATDRRDRSASVLEETEDTGRDERAERLVREGPAKTIGRMRQPRADAPSVQDRRDGGD